MLVRKAEVLVFLGKAASLSAADESLLDLLHPLAEAALHSYMQQDIGHGRHVEYLPIGQSRGGGDSYSLEDVSFRGGAGGSVRFNSSNGGSADLQLKHLPVFLAGLEIRENSSGRAGQTQTSFDDDSLLVAGDDYWLDMDDAESDFSRSGIVRRNGAWSSEPRSIKATYYGGWRSGDMTNDGAAGAIKLAALHTVASAYWLAKHNGTRQGSGPLMSEGIGKYHYSLSQQFLSQLTFTVPFEAKQLLQPFRNYGRIF